MKVSVIVCTYSPKMFEHFTECVESLLKQTFDDIEIVCIVDGNREYFEMINESDLIGEYEIKLFLNEKNLGLLESRNRGAKLANGDIVAFIDDDAIADRRWVEELVKIYEEYDALAVGGRMEPLWLAKKPKWFPEEFYWLIGVNYIGGFPDEIAEVRNTFGSNLSFRRDVFLDLGGFNVRVGGIKGKRMLQGGETELCIRLYKRYGRRVIYNPRAVVYHKIFERRTKLKFLVKRAFLQGVSKAVLEGLERDVSGERNFLKFLLTNRVPKRFSEFLKGDLSSLLKLGVMGLLTLSVLTGYAYAKVSKKAVSVNQGK